MRQDVNGFYCLEVTHVKGKGCSGPDIKENCLKLCGPASMGMGCHGADHKGDITDDELFAIAASFMEPCRGGGLRHM